MKKFFAILLAVAMFASMATFVSAASTTTLTTTVPGAAYTLNIPADQEIEFGATATNIGDITVTNSSGFAWGKNLKVTLSWEDFKSDSVSSTIPFHINAYYSEEDYYVLQSGDYIYFEGQSDGSVSNLWVHWANDRTYAIKNFGVAIYDWGKALAGDYTATITYTAEVVV
ncbi:MAG: hypothetical protein IKT43_03890 [Clostridia bacterium]|nr:hypothetical protein [Clostridia bacterium]